MGERGQQVCLNDCDVADDRGCRRPGHPAAAARPRPGCPRRGRSPRRRYGSRRSLAAARQSRRSERAGPRWLPEPGLGGQPPARSAGCASACEPSSCACRCSAAAELRQRLAVPAAAGEQHPGVRCSSSLMPGPVSGSRARAARCSQSSPSSNSPVQMRSPARLTSAGAIDRLGAPAMPARRALSPPGSAAGSWRRARSRLRIRAGTGRPLRGTAVRSPGEGGALLQVPFSCLDPQRPRLDDRRGSSAPPPAGRCRARCRRRTGPVTGEARNLPARRRRPSGRAAAPRDSSSAAIAIRGGTGGLAAWWRRTPSATSRCAAAWSSRPWSRSPIAHTRASSGGPRRPGPGRRCNSACDGLRLPVEGKAGRMVGEQPRRAGPVACRLSMPDGVGDLAVPGEPPRGEPVQRRQFFGQRAAQLQPKQAAEQVVVAEPGPARVERHHERVGVFQVQQDPFRAGVASQQVGQLAVDPVEQARYAAAGAGPRAAAGPAFRPSGTRQPSGRCRRTPRRIFPGPGARPATSQPAGARPPSLRSADTASPPRRRAARYPAAARSSRVSRSREAQSARADLGQLPGQPELVQAQRGIAAGGQHRVNIRRKARQQPVSCSARLGGGQLVQIVDDQDECDRRARRAPTAPCRPSPAPLKPGVAAGGSPSPVVRRLRTALSRASQNCWASCCSRRTWTPRRSGRLTRPVGPRAQQRRLPAACRRRDDRHPLPGRPDPARRSGRARPIRPGLRRSASAACLCLRPTYRSSTPSPPAPGQRTAPVAGRSPESGDDLSPCPAVNLKTPLSIAARPEGTCPRNTG